jgi:hypothetical protein
MRLAVPALLCLAATAHANPRALPMTYTTDVRPVGAVEIEQYVDLVPLRAISPASSKEESYLAAAFQTEIEIGLLDRLELGLYLTYAPDYGDAYANETSPAGSGTGLKQRLKYVLADPEEWPIDVGVYGEIVENEREIELEAKLLLQRRFGKARVAANLSGEYELYFSKQRDLVFAPSIGVTYEVTPKIQLGFESWMRGEYPQNPRPASRPFGLGPHLYAGPTLMLNFGKLWWALGVYGRLTETGHDLAPGEPYGRVWMRSIVGYDL